MDKATAHKSLTDILPDLESRLVAHLRRISLPLLRGAIGIVFVWFGALKIANNSPVADFVANTLPWLDRAWLVPALGIFEMALGVAIMIGRFTTIVCAALIAHLTGTFLALITQPTTTFQHGNIFLLTTEGEFVVKNVVFIAAALVLAARFHKAR